MAPESNAAMASLAPIMLPDEGVTVPDSTIAHSHPGQHDEQPQQQPPDHQHDHQPPSDPEAILEEPSVMAAYVQGV